MANHLADLRMLLSAKDAEVVKMASLLEELQVLLRSKDAELIEATNQVQELQKLLKTKDSCLYELRQLLKNGDLERKQLESKLHQYQSIVQLPSQHYAKERAIGISAESYNAESSNLDSLQQLEKYSKSKRMSPLLTHHKNGGHENFEEKLSAKEDEIRELQILLRQKDAVIANLTNEIRYLRDNSSQRVTGSSSNYKIADNGAAPHLNLGCMSLSKVKRVAVSGEPSGEKMSDHKSCLKSYDKAKKTKDLIRDAILDNDFLKNLDVRQIQEIVDCMYPTVYQPHDFIIKEGEVGHEVYVMEEGEVEVTKDSKHLQTMKPGKVFGELAILYNCTRTASVRALNSQVKLWAIDRPAFQTVMVKTNIIRQQDYIELLKRLSFFSHLDDETLSRLADTVEENFFDEHDHVVRHGAHGSQFYIVKKGQCKLFESESSTSSRTIEAGEYFGEESITGGTLCINSVVVTSREGCILLTIDQESYKQVLGTSEASSSPLSLEDALQKQVRDSVFNRTLKISDFKVVAILGVGGFGRVQLVQFKDIVANGDHRSFALKTLKKKHIVDTRQQEHVMNEKNILLSCNSDFIVRLYATFKDAKYLYMVFEACLGGEAWTILRDRSCFDDGTTRFYTACALEALQYLHNNGIVYRDLKPENMLLDVKGFVKMCDFGFAKKIGNKKTWTFCGTPEYVPPEIILNRGHDLTADYWSLGVLIFELLTGNPPFVGSDPMKTYNIILKGIDAITFPRRITKTASNLIRRLCRDVPSERLGAQKHGLRDIRKHKWFEGFNWDGLVNRTLRPPIIPVVNSATDVRNFDKYDEDETPIPPDDLTGWDATF